MKKLHLLTPLSFLLICVFMSFGACAQNNKANRPSPPASATGEIGPANITINYSSPAVKGRTIWGELVPFGQVWRAGANEATTFEVDQDVMVEGKLLPAGKYSFYTIPGEEEWTIIFNKAANQWGTEYDDRHDALRVNVKPRETASMNERLKYDVTDDGIVLMWEKMEVPVSVKVKE